jgi:hypothetical protein
MATRSAKGSFERLESSLGHPDLPTPGKGAGDAGSIEEDCLHEKKQIYTTSVPQHGDQWFR